MTRVIVSSIARAVAAICFQDVVMTKMMSAAAAAYLRYSEGFMTCVDIKVQVVLQLGVSRGRSEVLLSGYGRVYRSEVVSEFGPKT